MVKLYAPVEQKIHLQRLVESDHDHRQLFDMFALTFTFTNTNTLQSPAYVH